MPIFKSKFKGNHLVCTTDSHQTKSQVNLTLWKQKKKNCLGTGFALCLLHKKLNKMVLCKINHKPAHNALLDSTVLKYTDDF